MNSQTIDSSTEQSLRDALDFYEPSPAHDATDFAATPEQDSATLARHINSLDLAQLFKQDFHPQSSQRGSIDIDAIGRQLALDMTQRLRRRMYFSASQSMPRHFSVNLLELKEMVTVLTSRVKSAELESTTLLLSSQWSALERRLDISVTTALSDSAVVTVGCSGCIPVDNRFPQQDLRARVTLKHSFEAMIVKRWLLRQGISLAQRGEPGSILLISDDAIVQSFSTAVGKRQAPKPHIIARVHHRNHWLFDIEQTILSRFQGEPAGHDSSRVIVIHSFKTDPNQSPLIRLLIQSRVKFRIVSQYGAMGRYQRANRDTLLIDFTPEGATQDHIETIENRHALDNTLIITRKPLNRVVPQKSLSMSQLANLLQGLIARNDLPNALGDADTGASNRFENKPSVSTGPSSTAHKGPEVLIFDDQLAEARAGGNKALALELKTLLRQTLREDLLDLVNAAGNRDIELARNVLHKMAGGLAMTGAPALENLVTTVHLELANETDILKVNPVIIQAEQLLSMLSQPKRT